MLNIDDIQRRCFNTFLFHYGPLPFERLFIGEGFFLVRTVENPRRKRDYPVIAGREG